MRLICKLLGAGPQYISTKRRYSTSSIEYNEFNIQLLPRDLHARVFPKTGQGPPASILGIAREHLKRHSIPFDQKRPSLTPLAPDKIAMIPKLVGHDLSEHFYRLGMYVGEKWIRLGSLAEDLDLEKYPLPMKFTDAPGWTLYPKDGSECKAIEYPNDSFMIFDTESSWALSKYPLFAVALGPSGWYSWTSPDLSLIVADRLKVGALIPMGFSTEPQLVIGHNISFDRIHIADEYNLELSERRFVDTLSLHCAIAGLSSQQRPEWTRFKKQEEESGSSTKWQEISSMNNLVDALKLHTGLTLDKSDLQILIDGDPNQILANKERILQYCARDVQATARLFQSIWRRYRHHCPHPASQAGMLMMGSMILPVNREWDDYISRCEHGFQESLIEGDRILSELAESTASLSPEQCDDPWLRQLDWTPIPARYTSIKKKPIGDERLFGKPAWYAKHFSRKTGRCHVTTRSAITPLLLKLTWRGHPVRNVEDVGWCYLVPVEDKDKEAAQVGAKRIVQNLSDPNFAVFRIPHLTEEDANVGSLFSKGYSKAIEQEILSSKTPNILSRLLGLTSQWSFWTGYRERLMKQLVVYKTKDNGFIIPGTVVMGTVTRRAVENAWMTAGNPKKGSAGSEQKAMVRPPPGWLFVGADVDSQELWIASLLGDAAFAEHGATAMGWMTLQGSRQDSTDLHSRTAAILGMKRDDAKIFTYGRIYGAGVKYAASLLSRFNPKMDTNEAKLKANELYSKTKGRKEEGVYCGGSESFMFNQLERIATSSAAVTPVLGCRISEALSKDNVGSDFMTSRINWAVQSSGVDYLHLLLVSIKYLCDVYSIPARLAITIHDEVRFLVKEGHELRAALALQIGNLWVRSMFAYQLGLNDLPYSVAFFSLMDIDKVLRKEPAADCITPTNPSPIASGRSLNIFQLFDQIGSSGLGTADQKILERVSNFIIMPVRKPFEPHERQLTGWEESLWRQIDINSRPPTTPELKDKQGKPRKVWIEREDFGKGAIEKPKNTAGSNESKPGMNILNSALNSYVENEKAKAKILNFVP